MGTTFHQEEVRPDAVLITLFIIPGGFSLEYVNELSYHGPHSREGTAIILLDIFFPAPSPRLRDVRNDGFECMYEVIKSQPQCTVLMC